MKSWEDFKKGIKSIPKEEIIYLELLADVVCTREAKGITQREIAEMLGLQQPAIARFESPTGQNAPNLITVIKYLDVLGMKLSVIPKED